MGTYTLCMTNVETKKGNVLGNIKVVFESSDNGLPSSGKIIEALYKGKHIALAKFNKLEKIITAVREGRTSAQIAVFWADQPGATLLLCDPHWHKKTLSTCVRLLDYAYTADEVGMSVKDSKQTVFRRKHLLEKFVNGHSQWVAHPVTDAISKSSWCFDLNGKMVAPGDHHENKIEWYQEHGQSAPITIARRAGDIASCIVPKSSYNTLV